MTRDECLCAISNAFKGVQVTASVDLWNLIIETNPRRELILSEWFVDQHINRDGISPEELTQIIQSIDDDKWCVYKEKSLILNFGVPSSLMTSISQRYPKLGTIRLTESGVNKKFFDPGNDTVPAGDQVSDQVGDLVSKPVFGQLNTSVWEPLKEHLEEHLKEKDISKLGREPDESPVTPADSPLE